MKKTFHLAALSLLAAFTLFSCQREPDEYYYSATTQLSSPDLTVKVYPGANVLTWKTVSDAVSYDIYRTVDGIETKVSSTNNLYFVDDFDNGLQDNTSYTYRLVANPKTTAPLTASSTTKSVKTRASDKVATTGTAFSDLATYEESYDKNASVLSSDTITVSQLNSDGTVTVTFPTKAYATYSVKLVDSDKETLVTDGLEDYESSTPVVGANYANDSTVTIQIPNIASGTKKVLVTATPYYSGYTESEYTASTTVSVASLDVIGGSATAYWTANTSTSKTVRLVITPQQLTSDGSYVPLSYYTVYRVETPYGNTAIAKSYTKIETALTEESQYIDNNGNTIEKAYYLDDTFTGDSSSTYSYVIVVSNNGKYGTKLSTDISSGNSSLTTLVNTTNAGVDSAWISNATTTKKIRVVIYPATFKKDGSYVPTSYYTVYRTITPKNTSESYDATTTKLSPSFIEATSYTDANGTSHKKAYYFDDEISDISYSANYTYKIVLSNNGSDSKEWTKGVSDTVDVTAIISSVSNGTSSYSNSANVRVTYDKDFTDVKLYKSEYDSYSEAASAASYSSSSETSPLILSNSKLISFTPSSTYGYSSVSDTLTDGSYTVYRLEVTNAYGNKNSDTMIVYLPSASKKVITDIDGEYHDLSVSYDYSSSGYTTSASTSLYTNLYWTITYPDYDTNTYSIKREYYSSEANYNAGNVDSTKYYRYGGSWYSYDSDYDRPSLSYQGEEVSSHDYSLTNAGYYVYTCIANHTDVGDTSGTDTEASNSVVFRVTYDSDTGYYTLRKIK